MAKTQGNKPQHQSQHPQHQPHPLRFLTVALSLLVIACLFFVAVRIYVDQKADTLSKAIAETLHLPVAFAAGHIITFNQYYAVQNIAAKISGHDLSAQDNSDLITQMVKNAVADSLLKEQGLSVSQPELDSYYQSVKSVALGANSQPAAFGLSDAQFEKLIAYPDLVNIKLQVALAQNRDANTSVYALSDQIQKLLSSGAKFSDLAQQYSEDQQSAQIGGEVGFTSSNDIVPEVYNALAQVKDHGTHVFASRYGLHIVQVESQDSNGPQKSTRYNFRQIFIKTADFSQWFASEQKNFTILRLK